MTISRSSMTTTTTPTTTTTTTPNHLRLLPPSPPKIRLNIIRFPPSHPHQEARGPHYHNNNSADPSASALSPPILSLFTAPTSMAIRPNADNVAAIAFVGNPLVATLIQTASAVSGALRRRQRGQPQRWWPNNTKKYERYERYKLVDYNK